jgi:hypothetical protein
MIKFIQREYKAILLGALCYGLFFTVTEFLKNYLIDIGNPIDSPYKDILHIILNLLGTITIALPGYVAGRLSVQSGTKNGILLMLICTIASFWIIYHKTFQSSEVIFSIAIILSNLMIPVTVGGLSGTVGKYHKEMRMRI